MIDIFLGCSYLCMCIWWFHGSILCTGFQILHLCMCFVSALRGDVCRAAVQIINKSQCFILYTLVSVGLKIESGIVYVTSEDELISL
jgi:hypothetical protein